MSHKPTKAVWPITSEDVVFAKNVARQLCYRYVAKAHRDDLLPEFFSDCLLGLTQAARTYNPELSEWRAHSYFRMKHAILRSFKQRTCSKQNYGRNVTPLSWITDDNGELLLEVSQGALNEPFDPFIVAAVKALPPVYKDALQFVYAYGSDEKLAPKLLGKSRQAAERQGAYALRQVKKSLRLVP